MDRFRPENSRFDRVKIPGCFFFKRARTRRDATCETLGTSDLQRARIGEAPEFIFAEPAGRDGAGGRWSSTGQWERIRSMDRFFSEKSRFDRVKIPG